MQIYFNFLTIIAAKLSPGPKVALPALHFNDSAMPFFAAFILLHGGHTLIVAGAAVSSASHTPVFPVAVAAALAASSGARLRFTPLRLSSQDLCAIYAFVHHHCRLYVAGCLTDSTLHTPSNYSSLPSSSNLQMPVDKDAARGAFTAIVHTDTESVHRVLHLLLNLDSSADAL